MKVNRVAYRSEQTLAAAAEFRRIELRHRAGSKSRSEYVSRHEADRLLASDLDAAEARARLALAWHDDDSVARYLFGAALHRKGRLRAAKEVLEALTQSQPQFSAAWSELGLVLRELDEIADAAGAHLHALGFDPLDEEAWYALGDLLRLPGDDEGSLTDDPSLRDAAVALHEYRYEAAEAALRAVLASRPADPRGLKLLADVLMCTDRWTEARPMLKQSLELAPTYVKARFRFGTMLTAHQEYSAAIPHIEELIRSAPDNQLYRHLMAVALEGNGEHERAMPEYEKLIQASPDRPGLWMQYAQIVKSHRPARFAALLDEILRRFPYLVDASYALATFKAFRFDASWIERIEAQFDEPGIDVESRAKLHFVLGKAFEDLRDYQRSFEHYRASNELLRLFRPPESKSVALFIWRAKNTFTPRFVQARVGAGCNEAGAIFVVGMPRAGSTLVEQILCSHSAIEGLGELPDLPSIINQLDPHRGGYPRYLKTMDIDRFRALGEEYMALIRARRISDKPFFTDKLPSNHAHALLIHLMLPNARIVDVRRHPLDCGFSCYKHYFPTAEGRPLDRRGMGRSYAEYVELMAHYDEILPGRIHRVIYEQLVENPEEEIRRLLGYLGLPFEEQCLRFHETERVVETISAEQVRMPLYKSGIAHWRHYEQWLGPMKDELGRVLELYPQPPKFYPRLRVRVAPRPLGLAKAFRMVKGTGQLPFEYAPAPLSLSPW